MTRSVPPLTAVLLVVACGGNAEDTQQAASPIQQIAADTTAHGIVRVVGADPITTVVLDAEGQQLALRGELMAELERLAGATVRVRGQPIPNRPPPPQRAVSVKDYDILSVNGAVPVVGTLRLEGDGAHVVGDSTVVLVSLPTGLATMNGAKVWVIGRREGGRLVVQSYGVIRNPTP